MELLQLKYFCDAANTENFSRTARKFGVPPSDISQSIHRLEKELSVNLFVRYANRIALSEAGHAFYKRISLALSQNEDAVNVVTDDGVSGRINMCINSNRRIIMNTVDEFKRQYPNVAIRTRFCSDPTKEDYDLIVSTEDKRLKKYTAQKLLTENVAVAVSRNSPWAEAEKIDISALVHEPFITMNEHGTLFELTKRICADHHFNPHIAIQSDDPFYIRRCVEFGLGIAIVPLFSWKGQFSDRIAVKPLERYTRTTFVYMNAGKYIPACTRHFLELLMQKCADDHADTRNT